MTDVEYDERKKLKAAPAEPGHGEEENETALEKQTMAFVVKIGAMIVSVIVFVVFGTISWFTMNRETNANGMQMKVASEQFEITSLSGGDNGAFYDEYHILVKDPSSLVWQMTADNNMKNYVSSSSAASSGSASSEISSGTSSTSLGIYPGSYGVISFNVIPKVDSINLKFTFDIIGYHSGRDENTSSLTMSSLHRDTEPGIFLNGHIQLFQSRTEVSAGNFVYSDPILSNDDMEKVISSKTFNRGANVSQQVDIYWVWPITLSQIVDARGCSTILVTEAPFTSSGSDYNNVVSNVLTYPDYYMKGFNSSASGTASNSSENLSNNSSSNSSSEPPNNSSSNSSSELTASIIQRDYDKYGDWYDRADNDIGMSIQYVLLKMTVTRAD